MLGFSSSTTSTAIPTAIKCSYRSKPCSNVRATKMNGDFHKLCEYHRRRANLNQQRVHQRRKLRQLDEQQTRYRSSVGDDESLSDIELEFECVEPSAMPCGDLPLPDLELLELLLSDSYCNGGAASSAHRECFQSDAMNV